MQYESVDVKDAQGVRTSAVRRVVDPAAVKNELADSSSTRSVAFARWGALAACALWGMSLLPVVWSMPSEAWLGGVARVGVGPWFAVIQLVGWCVLAASAWAHRVAARHATLWRPSGEIVSRVQQNQERFRQVLYQASDAMVLIDTSGVIVEANDRAAGLYECVSSKLRGRPLADLDTELSDALLGPVAERVASAGATLHSHEVTCADGRKIPLEMQVGAVEYGDARYLLVSARDLSERKRLEAQLMLSDRMASVGTLAAGVAHEINNPLTALMLNLELIERQVGEIEASLEDATSARLRRGLKRAREGGERVGVIVRDLKTFSRDEAEARTEVDLRQVIESTLGLAHPELRRYATTSIEYEGHCTVMANPSRLGQVVLNLALNAAHALDGRPFAENHITVRVCDREEQVALEVVDNGPGMEPEVTARVFDPFFTTKPAGVGTGLGLFICRNIIQGFDGEIEVDSAIGHGTTFRILLPAAPAHARPEAVAQRYEMRPSWPPPPSEESVPSH